MFEIFKRKSSQGVTITPAVDPTPELPQAPLDVIHHVGEGTRSWLESIDARQQLKFMRFGSHILAAAVERPDGSQTKHEDLYRVALAYGYDEDVFTGDPASDAGFIAREYAEGQLQAIRVEEHSNLYLRGDSVQRAMTVRFLTEALPGLIVTSDSGA